MHRHLCETHRHLCETQTHIHANIHAQTHKAKAQRHRCTDTLMQDTDTQVDTHRPMHRHTCTDTHTQRPSRCLPQAAFSRGFIWRLWANGPGWGELAAAAAWEEEPAVPIDVPACASAFCPDPVLGSQADRHGPLLVKGGFVRRRLLPLPGLPGGRATQRKNRDDLLFMKNQNRKEGISPTVTTNCDHGGLLF